MHEILGQATMTTYDPSSEDRSKNGGRIFRALTSPGLNLYEDLCTEFKDNGEISKALQFSNMLSGSASVPTSSGQTGQLFLRCLESSSLPIHHTGTVTLFRDERL